LVESNISDGTQRSSLGWLRHLEGAASFITVASPLARRARIPRRVGLARAEEEPSRLDAKVQCREKDDPRFIFTAAAHAQRAVDFLNGLQPQTQRPERSGEHRDRYFSSVFGNIRQAAEVLVIGGFAAAA
jgi:hypothetical protein